MDKDIIHAYLWRKIIHLAFTPSGQKDQYNWLSQYNQSLKDFWGLGQYPPFPSSNLNATIDTEDGLSVEYIITSSSKFSVCFLYSTRSLWTHDVDYSFFEFPQQTFLTLYNQEKQALIKIKSIDI